MNAHGPYRSLHKLDSQPRRASVPLRFPPNLERATIDPAMFQTLYWFPPQIRRNDRQGFQPCVGIVVLAGGELVELFGIGFPVRSSQFREEVAGFFADTIACPSGTAALAFLKWQPIRT